MISLPYFPEIYPDELIYSQLARSFVKSGCTAYRYFAEEIFQHPTVRPDIEFWNQLTPDAYEMLTRNQSAESLILEHTMFGCYCRFLPKERQNKAFRAMVTMAGNYDNLCAIPKRKNNETRYLRYCPICAQEDRERYGETWWHRQHQLIGINICPVHFCRLRNSEVPIGNQTPWFYTAEECAPEMSRPRQEMKKQDQKQSVNENAEAETVLEIERKVAQYAANVFQSGVDLESDVLTGDFFHSKMAGTQYRSVRGEQRNISLLHKDFSAYYRDLPGNWFTELWQIQKVLTNDRFNFFEVCLMGMFLEIPESELTNRKLPDKLQQEVFDEKVIRLHEQGLKYPEIARRLNASYNVVKPVGEGRYDQSQAAIEQRRRKKGEKCVSGQEDEDLKILAGQDGGNGQDEQIEQRKQKVQKEQGIAQTPASVKAKSGKKPRDWERLDTETLPRVREAIREIEEDGNSRPVKVNTHTVGRVLDMRYDWFVNNLPLCREEIEKHAETQEEYWAREVVWAVRQLQRNGEPLNWKHVRNLTNMRKRDFIACLRYIRDEEVKKIAELMVK